MVSLNVMNVYMRLVNIAASIRMLHFPYLKRTIKREITQNWYIFMMRFDINFVSFATKTIIGIASWFNVVGMERTKKNCRRREKSKTAEQKRPMYHRGNDIHSKVASELNDKFIIERVKKPLQQHGTWKWIGCSNLEIRMNLFLLNLFVQFIYMALVRQPFLVSHRQHKLYFHMHEYEYVYFFGRHRRRRSHLYRRCCRGRRYHCNS